MRCPDGRLETLQVELPHGQFTVKPRIWIALGSAGARYTVGIPGIVGGRNTLNSFPYGVTYGGWPGRNTHTHTHKHMVPRRRVTRV